MRVNRIMVALLGLAAALAGCGIGPSEVVSHGPTERDDRKLERYSSADLVRPPTISSPGELVQRYLSAAADQPTSRVETLRTYLADKTWTPPPGDTITVYRVRDIQELPRSTDTSQVTVTIQRIGLLQPEGGRIDDPKPEAEKILTLSVLHDPSKGLLLQSVPNELMLSDDALERRFDFRPIYFWDKTNERLIPEMRYVPGYKTEAEKAEQLVAWIFAGASEWLRPAVNSAPPAVLRPGSPVYTTDGTLVLDFQPVQLPEDEFARLATQLERTLRAGIRASVQVQLKIRGQQAPAGRSAPIDDARSPSIFAVVQGKVVRLLSASERGDSPVPLAEPVNNDVSWAVFSRREEAVAMVRQENGPRFLIGAGGSPKPVAGLVRPVEKAAWLEGRSKSALVLSDRKLYEVSVDGQKVTPVPVPGGGLVTDFSAMPDGRIVMVIDGELRMAVLYRNAETLAISNDHQAVPTALTEVRHVAFSNLNDLVIAGVGVNPASGAPEFVLTAVYVDGSRQKQPWQRYLPNEKIAHLTTDFRTGVTYYDYNSRVHSLQTGRGEPLPPAQVVRSSPAPGASGSPAPAEANAPITAASFEG